MANPVLSYWYRLYTNQTPAEQTLEKEIAKLGVRYRSQHIVMSIPCILDFYFPDYNLCVEVDDPSHDTKVKKDAERTVKLNKKGISVVRYTNAQVLESIEEVITSIQDRLA